MIVSPGRRPTDAAGVSALTFLTVRSASPGTPNMYPDATSTTARTMFTPGPGEDDRDALPRPLAPVRVGAEPVSQLVDRSSRSLRRSRTEVRLLDRPLELGERVSGGVEIARLERRLTRASLRKQARAPPASAGASCTSRSDAAGRCMPGNLHVAAERDRADSVLDPVARDLDERRREAQVEAARPHADTHARRRSGPPRAEGSEREAEDRDEDVHATFSASST